MPLINPPQQDTTAITGVLKGNGSKISACSNLTDVAIPTKATGAEITTGTDDAKFATAKSLVDANILSQAWAAWDPTITSEGGTPTTIGKANGYYTRIGKTVIARIQLTVTDRGSATGTLRMTMPGSLTARDTSSTGACVETQAVGCSGSATLGTTTRIDLRKYDGTTPFTNGLIWQVGLIFEAA